MTAKTVILAILLLAASAVTGLSWWGQTRPTHHPVWTILTKSWGNSLEYELNWQHTDNHLLSGQAQGTAYLSPTNSLQITADLNSTNEYQGRRFQVLADLILTAKRLYLYFPRLPQQEQKLLPLTSQWFDLPYPDSLNDCLEQLTQLDWLQAAAHIAQLPDWKRNGDQWLLKTSWEQLSSTLTEQSSQINSSCPLVQYPSQPITVRLSSSGYQLDTLSAQTNWNQYQLTLFLKPIQTNSPPPLPTDSLPLNSLLEELGKIQP